MKLPWKICRRDLGPNGVHFHVRDAEDHLVGDSLPYEEASLVAAAPELLEALKVMAGFHWTKINDDPNHGYSAHAQDEVEKAFKIIAKAEGEE